MTDDEVAETQFEPTFSALVSSRRDWLDAVLQPWCRLASRKELRLAELEWVDLAGRVSPEKSLWAWAWSRFPDLVNAELNGIDETYPVRVMLKEGAEFVGYPDARASEQGQLVLLGRDPETSRTLEHGPFSIDEIATVTRSESAA